MYDFKKYRKNTNKIIQFTNSLFMKNDILAQQKQWVKMTIMDMSYTKNM